MIIHAETALEDMSVTLLVIEALAGTMVVWNSNVYNSRVSCQKGPNCHAQAWRVGPFWQDTLDMFGIWITLRWPTQCVSISYSAICYVLIRYAPVSMRAKLWCSLPPSVPMTGWLLIDYIYFIGHRAIVCIAIIIITVRCCSKQKQCITVKHLNNAHVGERMSVGNTVPETVFITLKLHRRVIQTPNILRGSCQKGPTRHVQNRKINSLYVLYLWSVFQWRHLWQHSLSESRVNIT